VSPAGSSGGDPVGVLMGHRLVVVVLFSRLFTNYHTGYIQEVTLSVLLYYLIITLSSN